MSAESIEKQFDHALAVYKKCKQDVEEATDMRQQLEVSLNENKIVKEELALLKPTGEVYKMVGPVLLRQDLGEAKENVDKRLNFIEKEAKQIDERTQSLETQSEKCKEKLAKLQKQYDALKQRK